MVAEWVGWGAVAEWMGRCGWGVVAEWKGRSG